MTSDKQKRQAWSEADTIVGKSPARWRRDRFGNRLRKGSYGTSGKYGWIVLPSGRATEGDSAPPVRRIEALHIAAASPAERAAAYGKASTSTSRAVADGRGAGAIGLLQWPVRACVLNTP